MSKEIYRISQKDVPLTSYIFLYYEVSSPQEWEDTMGKLSLSYEISKESVL